MSRLDRKLQKFSKRRVGTRTWSKWPPTRGDVDKSFNGYFWIKYPIIFDDQVMDILVRPVQVTYRVPKGNKNLGTLSTFDHWPLVARTQHGTLGTNGLIEHPDTIRELQVSRIEWQIMKPPSRIPMIP